MFLSRWSPWVDRKSNRSTDRRQQKGFLKSFRPRIEFLEDRLAPATFTVLNTNDDGDDSLRRAISNANATTEADTIAFNIPGAGVHTIAVLSALPAITNPVIIDGYSQPGASANTLAVGDDAVLLIELSGANAGIGVSGLTITAANCTVQGLVINRFQMAAGDNLSGAAVVIRGADAAGNSVQGNFIGTDATGAVAQGNKGHGIVVFDAPNNSVGGTTAAARNLISGNGSSVNEAGVFIAGGFAAITATSNVVQGNYIGLNAAGTGIVANLGQGVLCGGGSQNSLVGGTTAGARNVITGNDGNGILFIDFSTGNVAQGNFLGTNAAGDAFLGGGGVSIVRSSDNIVGGTAAGAGNLLAVNGNTSGVLISRDIFDNQSRRNVVQGNRIGVNLAGTAALGNAQFGIQIFDSSDNSIGGTAAGAGNVIAGSLETGLLIAGTLALSANNLVQGNFIGTNAAGTAAIPNGSTTTPNGGVVIRGRATANVIGGTAAGARNVISGNRGDGILIVDTGTNNNRVEGNFIGTNSAGTAALGNSGEGIFIFDGASGNSIGGTAVGAGNVISGNGEDGIDIQAQAANNVVQGNLVGTDVTGLAALGNIRIGILIDDNATNNSIGGTTTAARNIIAGNGADGLLIINSSTMNVVQGNFIGTDVTGTVALGNGVNGVTISNGSAQNLIGGTAAGAGNLISGNSSSGISIFADSATGNRVQGNLLGTNAAGTAALSNGGAGVRIGGGAQGNTIGGTEVGARNVISGNSTGVALTEGATGNLVQGNLLGTNAAGTLAVANDRGLSIDGGAHDNSVGGTTAAARNVISGNASFGVLVFGVNTTANLLQGNFVGTNAAGSAAVPNEGEGILISVDANGNRVGGTAAGAGNVISGNSSPGGANGISVASNGNFVEGNLIGLDAAGTAAVGNFGFGVDVRPGAQNNTISNNRIAFNGEGGVRIRGDATTLGNAIRDNSIFSNTGLGINLAGGTEDANLVTANDQGDVDAGPNGLQNFPILTGASNTGTGTTVVGTLTSTANATFTLQFFSNAAADPSGFGEGETLLGSTTVTTSGTGVATFTATFPTAVPQGRLITATATDAANNTSEFSAGIAVNPTISITDQTVTEGNSGTTDLVFSVNLSVASSQTITVDFATASGTATATADFIPLPTTTLTFNPGETTKTIRVQVNGDTLDETDETLFVILSGATNAVIADSQGQGTILDDDGPTISITDVTVTEGNSGTTDAVFAVTLSAASPQTVTVTFTTADGSAASPGDYQSTSGTLTFAPGETSKSITVQVKGDTVDETDETFHVSLSSALNAVIADAQGQGTILDDDGPSITIGDVTVTEGNTGTVNAVFTVRLSAASPQTVTIAFATANGSASSPGDFQSTSGTLTFNSGETSKTLTVLVNGDVQDELDENFTLTLSSATNAVIADAQGQGTIVDDDGPAITIDDATVTEGSSGTINAVFTVRLAAASLKTVTVDFATADGTATSPSDYQSITGTLTFSPGETTRTITVLVNGDSLEENDETFTVNLSNARIASLADGQATGTIRNDDLASAVQFAAATFAVAENAGTATITVTRTGSTAQSASVRIATSDGTANANADYSPLSALVTFGAGETKKTLSLSIVDDAVHEANETLVLTLSNPSGTTTLGSPATAVLTIQDNDPTITINPQQRFVTQLYRDLLLREPSSAELSFWSGVLDGGTSRADVVLGIERSPEYRTLLVQDLYRTLLNRAPDAAGLGFFTQFLTAGNSPERAAGVILTSPEYTATRAAATDPGFVTALYQDILHRTAAATEVSFFTTALARGATRGQVVDVVFASTEYRQNLVQQLYQRFLHRAADSLGRDYFVAALEREVPDAEIVAALGASGEYFGVAGTPDVVPSGFMRTANQRFVARLYTDLLGRPVDDSGLRTFSDLLDRGVTHAQVAQIIASSREYQTLVVQRTYLTLLARPVDPQSFPQALQLLASGGSVEQLQAVLLGSAEYFQQRGGGTVAGFLDALWHDVLGRSVDPAGGLAATRLLAGGASRTAVATAVLTSLEGQQHRVSTYFQQFVHRAADASGLAAWVNALHLGARDEQVIAGILGSREYAGLAP